MKKKQDLLPIIAQKIVVQAGLINTAIASIADILCVLREVLPKCSTEGCDGLVVGDVKYPASDIPKCYRCCLAAISKEQHVEWRPHKDSMIRLEDSVKSLDKAGFMDPEDMN